MPTNAFGQQVYDPNAGGNPLLSQLQQANANRPQPNGSNAYNWSGNGWMNEWGGSAGQQNGFMDAYRTYMAPPPTPPSLTGSIPGAGGPSQGNNGDQVRSSVAPLSQGSQSAPQDRYGSAYEQNPNVTWSYGGQTTVNPLDRGQFLTQGAAQNLAGQLGQGYTNNAWQLGGPAAYSAPMQTINNLHNAGLVQQMLDRGMPIDQVRSQLDREAAMARGGTQTTLNNPAQAQSESERMYQSMGLVRGADGQWRTPQNAQQTGAANGPPQASPSQRQRYGPLVGAMQQQRMGQGSQAMSDPGEAYNGLGQSGGFNISAGEGGRDGRGWTPNPSYGMMGNLDNGSSAMRNQPYLPNGGQAPFRNAMFGQRLGQYGQGQSDNGTGMGWESPTGNARYMGPNSMRDAPAQQYPSMQQVRGGQANNLGYDPYYYGPQARGPQARQPGWQYPQNTGAFQLYNHGSQESNDLSAFNQRMQSQEQASMPASWRTAQSAGRGGGGGSWDWNQGARAY